MQETRTSKVYSNGLTYKPGQLTKEMYKRLNEMYDGDVANYYSFREASTLRDRLHAQVHPETIFHLRYIAARDGVGLGKVIRKLLETVIDNDLEVKFWD